MVSAIRVVGPAVIVFAIAAHLVTAQQERGTWKEYLGGPDSSHYSALTEINRSNIDQLEVAWTYDTGDELLYPFSPLVVDDVAFLAAKKGSLVAVDATSGKELWVHRFPAPDRLTVRFGREGLSAQRGINYWESKDRSDRRILVSANGFLQAIDARTGELVDSFGDHGKVDLRTGIDRATRPLSSRTPGRVFENLIILGSATGEGYLAPPGDLRAFDVVSGKLAWVFHTVPRPGELGYDTWPKNAYKYMGGLDIWGEITVDEKRGVVYFPVASPKYELYGGDRPGNNLFGDCLIAADARTGKYLWHYQTVHHDLWDYDPAAAPQLVTVEHDGRKVDAVALASKNGFLFVFDRDTGKPLWPIEERPVPKSNVPGEVTAPTQPFPSVPPPFARQSITENDVFPGFMSPKEFASWKKRIAEAPKGLYTPPGLVDTVSAPGVNGGAIYFDAMSDPTTGVVYVKSKDAPALFLKLVPEGAPLGSAGTSVPSRPPEAVARGAGETGAFTVAQRGRAFYDQNCAICHRADAKGDRGPAIDDVVQRLGPDATREVILKGRGGMPPFSSLGRQEVNAVIEFLRNPAAVPAGSVPAAARAGTFRPVEPPYPPEVKPPPSRYKTGY
ncbi:MAG: PQQ-binding-like beta-propeller repeat protein, partial [Deltaproteobacteria bacterium]|nr:PQQ-binding-like beta-propeller repeat protein [Deltaproteobacteria bacterium]